MVRKRSRCDVRLVREQRLHLVIFGVVNNLAMVWVDVRLQVSGFLEIYGF